MAFKITGSKPYRISLGLFRKEFSATHIKKNDRTTENTSNRIAKIYLELIYSMNKKCAAVIQADSYAIKY